MKLAVLAVAFAALLSAQDRAYLPPTQTPGVVNPLVTQDNIQQTICAPGWTKTIRPKATYTNKLKASQMQALGITGQPSAFEEDHLISLEIGGHPTDPANLWPQPWPEARLKDVVETNLKRRVCSGAIPLADAQAAIVRDWRVLYLEITGKTVAEALAAK